MYCTYSTRICVALWVRAVPALAGGLVQHVDAADLVVRGAAHLLVRERHVHAAPRVPRGARRAPRAGPLGPRVCRRPIRQTGASSTPRPASASSSPPPAFSCVLVVLHSTSLDSTRLLSLSQLALYCRHVHSGMLPVRHLCRCQRELSTELASQLRASRLKPEACACTRCWPGLLTIQYIAQSGTRLTPGAQMVPHARPFEQTPG